MTHPNVHQLVKDVGDALAARDRLRFRRAVEALMSANYPLKSGWQSLSQPLMDFGELDLARKSINLFVEAMDGAPVARFRQAVVLAQTGWANEALDVLNSIPRNVPDSTNNSYLRGTISLNLGDIDVARKSLLQASQSSPHSGQILLALSETGSMAAAPSLADIILSKQRSMNNAPDPELACYRYAVGKTLDDLGDFTNAAEAFTEGAHLVRSTRPYSYDADRQSAIAAVKGFSIQKIQNAGKSVGIKTDRVIMVTGTPRSGTTLVEQILTSNSIVRNGDELGFFAMCADEMGGGTPTALHDTVISDGGATELAKRYLHLVQQRFGADGRVVDKTLDASRYIGLFASVLPDAPLIWVRRNAFDRAWSCYRTYFSRGVSWSWSIEEIAKHFALEERLLTVWAEILQDRLLVIDYEQLVEHPDKVIPNIARHCGIAEEQAMFEPHKNDRLVTTASVTQIRQPIHNDAIGKSTRYQSIMNPFDEAYQTALSKTSDLFN